MIPTQLVEHYRPQTESLDTPEQVAGWVSWFLDDQTMSELDETFWTSLDDRYNHVNFAWNKPGEQYKIEVNESLVDQGIKYIEENDLYSLSVFFFMTALYLKLQMKKFPDHRETIASTAVETFTALAERM